MRFESFRDNSIKKIAIKFYTKNFFKLIFFMNGNLYNFFFKEQISLFIFSLTDCKLDTLLILVELLVI